MAVRSALRSLAKLKKKDVNEIVKSNDKKVLGHTWPLERVISSIVDKVQGLS